MAANKVYDLNNLIPSTDGWVLETRQGCRGCRQRADSKA